MAWFTELRWKLRWRRIKRRRRKLEFALFRATQDTDNAFPGYIAAREEEWDRVRRENDLMGIWD